MISKLLINKEQS